MKNITEKLIMQSTLNNIKGMKYTSLNLKIKFENYIHPKINILE